MASPPTYKLRQWAAAGIMAIAPTSAGSAWSAYLGNDLSVSTVTLAGNAFSVGGSTLVVTSGLVGIGTTGPTEPLHVVGDAIYGKMQSFSAATSVTFSGLNGNSAKYYEISGRFRIDGISSNQTIFMRPNNDSAANYHNAAFRMFFTESAPTTISTDTDAGRGTTGLVLAFPDWNATGTLLVRGQLYTQTGNYRQYAGEHVFIADTSNNTLKASHMDHWHDTTSNITSLTIAPAAGNITGDLTLRAFR